MKRIKIFALVEGKIIDKLSGRVSGTFIRIHYILKHLKQKKDVKLIYIPFEYKQKYSEKYSKLNYCIDLFYHLAIPFLSMLIILFRRPHLIYFSYPNIVYNDKLNISLLRFAKRIGTKLLMYSHDWIEQSEVVGTGKNRFLSEKLERELVQTSDILVVTLSKYPKYETAMLPGGLEEEEFVKLKYEIHKERYNIAYVGAISIRAGIDILVDSAVKLHKKYPYVKLFLYGHILSLDEKTKKKIMKSEFIIQKVIPRTELINHFSKVDVFAFTYNPIVPYWNQSVGAIKLLEYIGSEIPFIATKCEGLRVITNGKGLLYVNHSVDDFCEKLEYLLKNPDERVRLSRELQELKKDNTWKKRADTLHDIIVHHLNRSKKL